MMDASPLPGLGDLPLANIVQELMDAPQPLVERLQDAAGTQWREEVLTLTDTGQALLRGKLSLLAFPCRERWLSGVKIVHGQANWH